MSACADSLSCTYMSILIINLTFLKFCKQTFQCKMKSESTVPVEYPKFLCCQLKNSRKNDSFNNWLYDIEVKQSKIKKTLEFLTIQIQGVIEQKPCEDIMILKDSTGKFKIVNCENALKSKTPLNEGMYCSVTGILIKEKGLPEVSAVKCVPIGDGDADKSMCYEYWPVEVEDYQLFMVGATLPDLKLHS